MPVQETQETWVWSLSQEDPLEEGMATCSSSLAWKIPWTEEPDGLQSIGSQRVGHDWACMHIAYEKGNLLVHVSERVKQDRRDYCRNLDSQTRTRIQWIFFFFDVSFYRWVSLMCWEIWLLTLSSRFTSSSRQRAFSLLPTPSNCRSIDHSQGRHLIGHGVGGRD